MGTLHILDLIIGVIFIYFLLSLICVALQEIKSRLRNERSLNLKKWICDNFNMDDGRDELGSRLWHNIIIDGLTQEGRGASYIPKEVFVSALLDEIHYESNDRQEKRDYKAAPEKEKAEADEKIKRLKNPFDFDTIRESIESCSLLPFRIKRVLRQIHSESNGNMDSFRERLERWFDQAMERNAGTFKKKAQTSVLIFSVVVAIALNADSIRLVRYFYEHPAEATRVVEIAQKYVNDSTWVNEAANDTTVSQQIKNLQATMTQIADLKLPLGWNAKVYEQDGFWIYVIKALAGWLITALAVSLGAPFWYDILNKLVDLRSSGRKPPETDQKPDPKAATETILG